jgi:phage gp36-like protein
MAYASQTDLASAGFPVQAWGQLTPTQINTALQNASDKLDTYFRGRYGDGPSPLLLTWDSEVTQTVAKIAAYYAVVMRGFDPSSGMDSLFKLNHDDAITWCRDVQRQQAHPVVTVAGTPLAGSVQPNLVSSSVVNLATGCRAPNRGW